MPDAVPERNAEYSSGLDSKAGFLCSRFSILTDLEQALMLAHLSSRDRSQKSSGGVEYFRAAHFYNAFSREDRCRQFEALIASDSALDEAGRAFLPYMRQYLPATLAVLLAAARGAQIGILTARGNRDGNFAMIAVIQKFLGVNFRRGNTYFINDETLNRRLREEGSQSCARYKFRILSDFAGGLPPVESGKYRVYFYDDEMLNVETVRELAAKEGLADDITAFHTGELSVSGLWQELLDVLQSDREGVSVPEIHFFDIDGTLINVHARMYVVDRRTGERVRGVTQEEFADNPSIEYWLENEHQFLDFSDFKDPERIRDLLGSPEEYNALFRA